MHARRGTPQQAVEAEEEGGSDDRWWRYKAGRAMETGSNGSTSVHTGDLFDLGLKKKEDVMYVPPAVA